MVLRSLSAGRSSQVQSRVSSVHTRLEVRPVFRRETQSPMSRPLRRSGRLVAIFLIGGSIITATSIPVSGQPRDRVVAELIDFSNEVEAEGGKVPSHAVLTGTLRAGETQDVQVHTCADIKYLVVGVCDGNCTDVDLYARNSLGESEDSDVLPDDVPILDFTPGATGFTTISVEMVSCEGSCDWGVQLYVDNPTAPSGVSGPANHDAPTWSSDWDLYLGTYRNGEGDIRVLRHEDRLVVIFPFSHDRDGSMAVLGPTDSSHLFRVESDGSSVDGEKVRFVVNSSGAVTAVFVAGQESRRVE